MKTGLRSSHLGIGIRELEYNSLRPLVSLFFSWLRGKLKTTVTYLVERRWELLSQLQTIFDVRAIDEVRSIR